MLNYFGGNTLCKLMSRRRGEVKATRRRQNGGYFEETWEGKDISGKAKKSSV